MVIVPDGEDAALGEEAPPPMGGNTIRMPPAAELAPAAVAEFFGWSPTAFATALMIAALGKVSGVDDAPEGTGVVEPFVLLLLLVLAVHGAASDPPV